MKADASPLLEMRGITKRFGPVVALDDVSFEVMPDEIHAICGENGAGKSTLMNVLSGVHPHDSYDGEVYFDDELLRANSLRDCEARGIVIIHQELALSPHMTVAENLFLGNERRTRQGLMDWTRTHHEAGELLERVGLDVSPSAAVQRLGVGQQQLVEIAKALSKQVRVLILDEPTSALNDEDSQHLLDLVRQFKHYGIACIMISHKLNEIEEISDRVTVIRDGHVIETLAATQIDEDRIITGMVGRDMEHRFPERRERAVGHEALRIEDWTVHDDNDPTIRVVDGASLAVHAGEVVGLCGLMGAGRTELAMSIFGGAWGKRVAGRMWINGNEVELGSIREAIDHGLAYSTEDRKTYGLNLIEDVRRNITISSLHKLVRRGLVDETEEVAAANHYRRAMNIKVPTVFAPAGQLSGGNQQKVVLSKWIFSDPDILILDEPTRGIDVGAKYEIYTIIQDLAADGKAVIVISSELRELLGVADRIYALSEGRITGQLPVEHATQEKLFRLMTMEKGT